MSDQPYILEMTSIDKSFFGVPVLSKVNFNVKPGELHALVGENGAGKSTLMKIIMGIYNCDGGEILFEGHSSHIRSARDALRAGISMIHQELNPIMEMTVAENVFVGREKRLKWTPFVDFSRLRRDALELLREYGMEKKVTPSTKMSDLNIAQIQMIEIIKAVSYNARLIIMDEPTSSLTTAEADELFTMIERLKKENVGIIYISHRLDEVMDLADRISVLRDGNLAGCVERSDVDRDQIISMMVGRELAGGYPANHAEKGEVVLKVENLTRRGVFENINFEVRKGEILGFAGLVGAGRSEVMRAVVGFDRYDSGEIRLNGKPMMIKHPKDAKDNHILLAPEDRKALGLVLCRNIKENISLQNYDLFSFAGFLKLGGERRKCTESAREMAIKMNDLSDIVENLSGGNQQKVVLGKCLMSKPQVMILDEPTRGIDIGSKASIYNMMVELTKQGIAIIMISSEMPELIGMSDRIIVMANGAIRGEYTQKDEDAQKEILRMAL